MLSGSFNSPRRLIAMFMLLLVLPAAAVAWLGIQLIDQDRQLAARQVSERRDITADRVVAELERAVSGAARQLDVDGRPQLASVTGDDAVTITIEAAGIEVHPQNVLLYQPVLRHESEPVSEFSRAEALEFRSGNLDGAIREYRTLASRSSAPDIRAGALVRLARALKNAGRPNEALQAYVELEKLSSAHVAGVPADLAARHARAALLQELGRDQELRAAAGSLRSDLLAARWTLDRGTFESYRRQTDEWLGNTDLPNDREALSAAVDWLFHEHQRESLPAVERRSLRLGKTDVTVLWHSSDDRLNALVAGPRFVQREWLGPVRAKIGHATLDIALTVPEAEAPHPAPGGINAAVRRPAAETGLPWTVTITDPLSGLESAGLASRARMVAAGVALLFLTVITGGYLVARTIGRELAVARLQSDFVAAVSHEFRTPLTALRQFTTLLVEDDELGAEKRRSFYRAQARATDRLTNLVESLLDFGRMEAGAHPYRIEPLNIERLVSEVVDEFRRDPGFDAVSIECAIDPAATEAAGDRDALGRAIRNLLENAVKYSDADRRIDVSVRREGASIAVSVQDRGFGIARDEQQEIFNKFVRGSTSRQRGIKGTGIGLAMVRHIIAAHGGRVTLESEVGRGSTFTIWLPALPAQMSDSVVAAPQPREL